MAGFKSFLRHLSYIRSNYKTLWYIKQLYPWTYGATYLDVKSKTIRQAFWVQWFGFVFWVDDFSIDSWD